MLKFEKIDISHKEKMLPFLKQDNVFATERNFASLFIWGGHYSTEVCITQDFCYLRAKDKSESHYSYYPPLGHGDIRNAIAEIGACENQSVVKLFSLTAQDVEKYKEIFGESFACEENRDSFDYVYTTKAMIGLGGRAYAAKRNHINKFMALYDGKWEYRDIDFDADMDLIVEFQNKWCQEREESRHSSFHHEYCAIMRALRHHEALDIHGGILFVDGAVAAYTLAAPTNDTVIDILIEKGNMEVTGSYTVINNKFAAANCADYLYVNREEDMGIAGLRKAKLSYNPYIMVEKYTAQVTL